MENKTYTVKDICDFLRERSGERFNTGSDSN